LFKIPTDLPYYGFDFKQDSRLDYQLNPIDPTTPHQFDTLGQMHIQLSFEILIMQRKGSHGTSLNVVRAGKGDLRIGKKAIDAC